MKNDTHIRTLFRQSGLKATNRRTAIMKLLEQGKGPMSIADMRKKLPRGIDQVTLYRTLNTFQAVGLVRQVDFRHRHAHYELRGENGDHHHIICTVCGRSEDFSDCDAERLAGKVLKYARSFRSVTDHSLELYGVCNSCALTKKTTILAS